MEVLGPIRDSCLQQNWKAMAPAPSINQILQYACAEVRWKYTTCAVYHLRCRLNMPGFHYGGSRQHVKLSVSLSVCFFPRKCLFLICHVSPLTEWTGFSQMIPLISCLAYACQRQWGNCDKDVFEHFILRVRAIVKCYNVFSTSYGRYQHIKRHHCWPCCFPCFSFYILLYAYTTMSNGVPRAL